MEYNKYLEKMGFKDLSPIQVETMKNFNNKKNLVGVAPTGTGKTHAYLIPLIGNLSFELNKLQAIIIVPTNELVAQVKLMVEPLVTEDIKVKSYHSKMDKAKEISWLEKYQPHIVIATPEKLYEMFENGLMINTVKHFILDEADMMFDEEFLKQIDQLITRTPNAKYMLFSATITESMHSFIKKYFGSYDLIDTTKSHNLKIEQRLLKSQLDDRDEMLKNLLKVLNPFFAIIFISRKEDQQKVYDLLLEMNLNVGLLSGNLSQHERKNVINNIRNLKYQYLVASDLAARGLDFDVSHVINYDLPYKLEFFKHRSGRTGRMNKEGIVITITLNSDRGKIRKLEEMGFEFVDYRISNNEMVVYKKAKKVTISPDELNAIKKIPKPKKTKPNSRKKNKELVLKAKKEVRRKNYAKNR